ncbi:MAG: hypothetical protein KIT09_30480 [Bryobacteraceae bacterium]|nr:hypothetical protein [Bryobacteraceae bacterium]
MNTDEITDLEIGKAAEHLVVADLILCGYRAYLTDQGLPYDAVVDHEGKLYRVQVKSSREVKRMPQRKGDTPGYLYHVRRAGKYRKRQYADDEFDILALVALDIRIIAYLPFEGRILQTIYLRPPGHHGSGRTARTRTIDQFPIESVLAVLSGKRPVLSPKPESVRAVPRDQGTLFEVA